MRTFTEADQAYRSAIEASGRELAAAFDAASSVPKVDLNATDITHAVLLRLKSFLLCQEKIKSELGKVYAAPAADFFVESVCFFLKVVLGKLEPSLTVASERNIVRRQGSMRPDISIWRGDKVVAAIECKTQLGWNRGGWLHDFEGREKRLATEFHDAKLFLLVMTGSNWPGFGDDKRVSKQFFVLLKDIWPNTFESSSAETSIVHPIEVLFREVLSHAKG
jgi:hypothetical protein